MKRDPRLWVAPILYVAVLCGGLYYHVAGLCPDGPLRTAGFAGLLVLLLALELWERIRFGPQLPRRLAIALLVARVGLFEVVALVDCSGLSRVLYLLVPFAAYFALGRRASYGLAALYLGAALVRVSFVPGWYSDQEIIGDLLMFFIGMLFAVSMAGVAVEAEAGRARTQGLLTELEQAHETLARSADMVARLATATERNRVARDIHDSLGHYLTAISVQLEKAALFLARDPDVAVQAISDARRSAAHALQDVRHSVSALREGFSLVIALGELVRGLDAFEVSLEIRGDEGDVGGPARMVLYRVAQEALTNARKHAGANRVWMLLELGENEMTLRVEDDGRGFVAEGRSTGFGFKAMAERLELVGGWLEVDTAPGLGTRLLGTIPRAHGSMVDGVA